MNRDRRRFRAALVVHVVAILALSGSALADPLGKSAALIVAEPFTDFCRDVVVHSTKDISYIEISYADGRVVRDEAIGAPDHAIDGAEGDEIDSVVVKSGTTSETFTCVAANSPPTAILELQIAPDCAVVREDPPLMQCPSTKERTEWTTFDGSVVFLFGNLCINDAALCRFTFRGTSASGAWSTDPATDLVLTIAGCDRFSDVTLTVTDSAGNTDSDSMRVGPGNCED